MYAVIKQGGRQYKVTTGDVIQIDKLGEEKGNDVELGDVLLLQDGDDLTIGSPIVEGAVVKAKVIREDKSKKVIVFKFKRRKGYKKTQGHRQDFTDVRITEIALNGKALAAAE